MGTTTLQIVMGEGLMSRLSKWRAIEKYPPEKTNDSFCRAMLMKSMDKAVPEE
jgi:hypothetical protein